MEVEFTCFGCNHHFECEWEFGDDVTCPKCQTLFETDYEESDDGPTPPWLVGIKPPKEPSTMTSKPPPTLYTSAQIAAILNLTAQRVGAIARRRGIGRMMGNTRVFTQADIEAMRPGRVGYPKGVPRKAKTKHPPA